MNRLSMLKNLALAPVAALGLAREPEPRPGEPHTIKGDLVIEGGLIVGSLSEPMLKVASGMRAEIQGTRVLLSSDEPGPMLI